MSRFCEDDSQLETYPNGLIGKPRGKDEPFIRCLQWGDNLPDGEKSRSFHTVNDLLTTLYTSQSRLRVVFLPIVPLEAESEQFRELFRHFSIPSAVPAERMRNVSHAFGASTTLRKDLEFAWFHFLCRNVEVDDNGQIVDLGYLQDAHKRGDWQDDPGRLWIMCDFFMHVKPPSTNSAAQSTVTLLCFGPPDNVFNRFEKLLGRYSWRDIPEEPYLLFDLLFNDLHESYDKAVWKLSKAVNPAEKEALERAGELGNHGRDFSSFSFRPLHNIQKNCVFMVEAANASTATLDAIIKKLEQRLKLKLQSGAASTDLTAAAIEAMEYRKRNFHSTSLRLRSVDQRLSNVVQLTRTMVNQADSAILKDDSRAMKFIAALTLVFLPATGVASVFDTPFFENDNPSRMTVASNFWIFWAVVGPLTLVVGTICFIWYKHFPRSRRPDSVWRNAEEMMSMPFKRDTFKASRSEKPDKRRANDIELGNGCSTKG